MNINDYLYFQTIKYIFRTLREVAFYFYKIIHFIVAFFKHFWYTTLNA